MENNTSFIELTSPEIEKWDRDLETIKSINELSQKLGGDFVLKGGLASEAYTNGRQKRAHGDIDATYYVPPTTSLDQVASQLDELFTAEETKWEKYDSKVSSKIEYRENDDTRDFQERRRLEMYVRETNDEAYETGNFETKQLIDSKGNIIEVKVMPWAELVSMKVRNIYMTEHNIGTQGRPSSSTDYADLKLLLSVPEFDKQRLISNLSKLIKSLPDTSEALIEAQKEYDFVANFIKSK